MPNVQMPNGDVVAFPDDMPREQIKGLIAKKFPNVGLPATPDSLADGMIKGQSKQQLPEAGVPRTMLDQSLQGATFGFADEATDRLGALGASLYTGEKYGDVLKDARGDTKRRMQAQWEQNPGTTIASNIAGSVLTGSALSAPKAIVGTIPQTGMRGALNAVPEAGAAIANSLRSGPLWQRAAKGVAAGSTSGAAFGAGTAEEGKRGEGARMGGLLGGALGGALPVAGAAAGNVKSFGGDVLKGITARGVDELDDAASAIKQSSSQAYQAMRNAGAIINRPRAVNIANKLEAAVQADGKLNARLHANTLGLIDDFKQAAKQSDFTLEDLDQWRQLFGEVAGNFNDKINQRKASIAMQAIDDAVGNLSKIDIKGGRTDAIDALNMGRSEWAKARTFERISDIVKLSKGDANYMKRELAKILDKPKLSRGLTPGELDAIKKASTMTTGDSILKTLGRFGIDNARLGTGVGAAVGSIGAGAAVGVPGAVAAPVVGTAARQARKLATRGQIEDVLKAIESRGGQSVTALPGKPVTPLLSAPAGAAGGMMGGADTRTPMQPSPGVPIPRIAPQPQSNLTPLAERVMMAESAGNQNALSPKGAIGLMQIMPKTAPEAAKMAGLPYDPVKLKNDPQYNAALGQAYLNGMLEKYQSEPLALMAYNWGPGNVDMWLKSGAKPERVPKETQNYLKKILG